MRESSTSLGFRSARPQDKMRKLIARQHGALSVVRGQEKEASAHRRVEGAGPQAPGTRPGAEAAAGGRPTTRHALSRPITRLLRRRACSPSPHCAVMASGKTAVARLCRRGYLALDCYAVSARG
jgi:hypothetical protein